MNMEYQ
ncbi:uncharacterized protein FTOL_13817 [Fusarium torulosum]|nr:uncharacterized protein FTOL_13817 [Fusarium torulosum]